MIQEKKEKFYLPVWRLRGKYLALFLFIFFFFIGAIRRIFHI